MIFDEALFDDVIFDVGSVAVSPPVVAEMFIPFFPDVGVGVAEWRRKRKHLIQRFLLLG